MTRRLPAFLACTQTTRVCLHFSCDGLVKSSPRLDFARPFHSGDYHKFRDHKITDVTSSILPSGTHRTSDTNWHGDRPTQTTPASRSVSEHLGVWDLYHLFSSPRLGFTERNTPRGQQRNDIYGMAWATKEGISVFFFVIWRTPSVIPSFDCGEIRRGR